MWAFGWGSGKRRGLKVWVLQMLEREPLNGAEIMDQMDRMTMGWWRPSPGSIYPLLEQLEKDKLVTKQPDGRYRLADEVRRGPEWMREGGFPGGRGPRTSEDAVRELEAYTQFLEDLITADRGQLSQVQPRVRQVADRLGRLGQSEATA
jgi:DNA-binding PadR family transcriptional regulator